MDFQLNEYLFEKAAKLFVLTISKIEDAIGRRIFAVQEIAVRRRALIANLPVSTGRRQDARLEARRYSYCSWL
jgi:hypothetical protein